MLSGNSFCLLTGIRLPDKSGVLINTTEQDME